MDARERKRLLGQWGVRDPLPRELEQGAEAAADLEGSPLVGRRLLLRASPFRVQVDSYVASLGGPLPYMVRLREIERLTREADERLERRWHELALEHRDDPAAFGRAWRACAERENFLEVNDLIDRHNRWYPVEARLPMDPRRRDYALVNGRPYRRRPLDAGWVLERFPPELAGALVPRQP